MNGDAVTGIEDIVRRNVATLRSKAGLTQQGLADEMLLRGIAWTRETVAQVETTNRRMGLTEAVAVAASLDVPLARLAATGADAVAVGDAEWTTAYLGAAIAGTAGDVFPPGSYSVGPSRRVEQYEDPMAPETPIPPDAVAERARGPRERRTGDVEEAVPTGRRSTDAPSQAPQKTADRIERRLRLRVTAGDVDTAAQQLWSRSLDAERERRVSDRHALTGGSLQTIRGHVSRDLDRELAHEMERQNGDEEERIEPSGVLSADEAAWEATRLNIILANKGYGDSDVTRWWNFTRHRELGDRTIAEAWNAGDYAAASRLVESLPDKHGSGAGYRVVDE
jgi:transcriptional regulator with XRE-family HTH domain